MLDQPIRDVLRDARSVLLLGAGGGYDVLGAVPLLVELVSAGKRVHVGGVSFTSLNSLPNARPHPQHPILHPVTPANAADALYCPEAWLARWLEARGGEATVWAAQKTGVRPLRAAYEWLASELSADAIILVDGGVDLILRGDETSIGTPSEDLLSLAAVKDLPVGIKICACLGFGTEIREGIQHAQVLARIAELTPDLLT